MNNFQDGEPVWCRDWDNEKWLPRVFKRYDNKFVNPYCVYYDQGDEAMYKYCAPRNNGQPPEE